MRNEIEIQKSIFENFQNAFVVSGLFSKLHKLELWNRNNRWGSHDSFQYSICTNTLKQLLLFSNMDFLLLYKVDTMTDQLFNQILSENPMKKLHNVILDHCQAITSATIWKVNTICSENWLKENKNSFKQKTM